MKKYPRPMCENCGAASVRVNSESIVRCERCGFTIKLRGHEDV